VQEVLSEGWAWLVREGLLVLSPRDSSNSAYVISRRGRQLRTSTYFEAFKRGTLLGHRTLDAVLTVRVISLFSRGQYDLAILAAFKEVEVRTRSKGNYLSEKLGTDLMRDAFNPDGGPLANQAIPKAKRQGRSDLFAGAIASFKNHSSHRNLTLGPEEARKPIS
jgi:hypothetical protein